MDEDDEIPDIREQIFHNTVREQIVSSTRRNTDTTLCPHSADNTIFFPFRASICLYGIATQSESEQYKSNTHAHEWRGKMKQNKSNSLKIEMLRMHESNVHIIWGIFASLFCVAVKWIPSIHFSLFPFSLLLARRWLLCSEVRTDISHNWNLQAADESLDLTPKNRWIVGLSASLPRVCVHFYFSFSYRWICAVVSWM